MLEVRVLGGLAADLDGRPVQLPADARAHELLAWLVVAPGPRAVATREVQKARGEAFVRAAERPDQTGRRDVGR